MSRRVIIVAFPGVELLDVSGPASVFAAASQLVGARRGYRVELVAERAGPLRSSSGVQLVAERSLRALRGPIDTLLVGGGLGPAVTGAFHLAPWIARVAARARRTASVCSGAFLLAEAGLLRRKRVVTHWAGCDELARRYPECQVDPDPIFIQAGNIWTSAGVTSGIDLSLALVEQDLGTHVALEVARWQVMYLRRPGGQSQFSVPLAGQRAQAPVIAQMLPWLRENLEADLSVRAMARRASMSERNFARVFAREVGEPPAAYVEQLRIEAARHALEQTDLAVKEIAAKCGFGPPETLHRAFRRRLSVTPLEYRARFRSRRASAW